MDDKYIENIGMTDIDEGAWDQLKAKASGLNQMRKNVFSRGHSDVKDVQFDSLFKNFLGKCIRTLEDFHNVISPKIDANKLTPAQEKKIGNLFALRSLMKKMEKIPVREANIFNRPFSAIGAQAWGNLDNIIVTYQKLLRNYYTTFINDASKLNIVPKEYLARKIVSAHPFAKSFFQKFNSAVGQTNTSGKSPVLPPTQPTSTIQTNPDISVTNNAPEVSNVSNTSPSAASVDTPPISPSVTPVGVTPSDTETHPTPSHTTRRSVPLIQSQPIEKTFQLSAKALEKVIGDLSKGIHEMASQEENDDVEDADMNMASIIRKYLKRDATKAEYPFPKNPPIEVIGTNKEKSVWHLRYKYAKDIRGHEIQFNQEDYDPRGKLVAEDSTWQPFLKFNALDILDKTGHVISTFDVVQNIFKANPDLANKIKETEQKHGVKLASNGVNVKIANALNHVVKAESREDPRGKRQLAVPKPDKELRGDSEGDVNPADPSVTNPTSVQKTDTKVPPEQQSRFISTVDQKTPEGKPSIPPHMRGLKPKIRVDFEKEQEKLSKGEEPSIAPVKPGVKKKPPVSKVVSKKSTGSAKPSKKPPTPEEIKANREKLLNKKKSITPTADDYEKRKAELGIDVKKSKTDDEEENISEGVSLRDFFSF